MQDVHDTNVAQSATARLLAVAMLLIALFPLPYGYYTLVRWVVTAVSVWTLILIWSVPTSWRLILATVAILFNPLVPIHLSRTVWAPIDVVVAVLLAVSAFSARTGTNPRAGRSEPAE